MLQNHLQIVQNPHDVAMVTSVYCVNISNFMQPLRVTLFILDQLMVEVLTLFP